MYREQDYDDSVCVRCNSKLPDTVEPDTPQDLGYCNERCQVGEGWIANLRDLADHLGVEYDEDTDTTETIARRIARSLYKYTDCGIGFSTDIDGVSLSGYCEGDVGECPDRRLRWGFWGEDFDREVEAADRDGCDLWDETHGCHACAGQTEEEWEECGVGKTQVNPKCSECNGHGVSF